MGSGPRPTSPRPAGHNTPRMRLGISIGTTFQTDDYQEGPGSVLEQARAAARSGLDSLSVGDHHATGPVSMQNVPIVGRILAEWDSRPVGCLFLVPLWHPVLMAEQIGTPRGHAGRPVHRSDRSWRRLRAVSCDGGEAHRAGQSHRGGHLGGERSAEGGIRGQRALGYRRGADAPLPPHGVEWWIGAGAAVSIDRAARLGDCWYGNADLDAVTASQAIAVYREACARHGRDPVRIPIRKDVFVAETSAEAEKLGDALVAAGYRGFTRGAVAYGDPDSVAEQLGVFGEIGFTDVIIRIMPAPLDATVRSVELAGEVRRRLQTV